MEIARLEAIYTARTEDFERKNTRVDARLKQTASQAQTTERAISRAFGSRLNDVFKGAASSVSTINGPLANLSNQVTSLVPMLGGATSAAGVFGIALGALAAASAGTALGIYNLTTSVAESTGKFIDLSQQVGFSVETLSGLANAAETSGGSIQSVTSSLFIFETRMQEAKEKGSEMSKIFKALKIDTTDHEKALRQALSALKNLSTQEERAAAGKKLFGRGVRELMAATKEAGDLDAYLNEQLKKGTLITTEAATRGDQLSDAVIEMGRAFESARRVVADQFGPDVLRVVKGLTGAIEGNRNVIRGWAEDFKLAVRGLQPLIAAVQALDQAIVTLSGRHVTDILGKILPYTTFPTLVYKVLQQFGSTIPTKSGPGVGVDIGVDPFGTNVGVDVGGGMFRRRNPLKLPIGGGGGGGGARSPRIDPGVQLLKQLEEELDRLTPKTRTQEIAQRLLSSEFDKTSDAIKKKIQITSMDIDAQKMILSIERERVVSMKTLRQEMEEFAELVREAGEAGLAFFSRRRRMSDITDLDLFDLGGGSTRVREDPATRRRSIAEGATRDRIATVDEMVARERERMRVERMQAVAEDLGLIFADVFDSIGRGWEDLWDNLLSIARSVSRQIVQDLMTSLFSNLFNVSPAGQPTGLVSLFTGFGKPPGRALGGPVMAGNLYEVNENRREFFRPNVSGTVVPLGQGAAQGSGEIRVGVFDDMRRLQEWRPNRILRSQKQMRKIGKVVAF